MNNSSGLFDLSVVVPIYNEQEVLPMLVKRLKAMMETMPEEIVEILLINDGSQDRTKPLIDEICQTNENFVGIHLSRNFGHQAAVTAGLNHAQGRHIAIIDGDLQDPPELIPEMVAKSRGGADVVYAIRTNRKEKWYKRSAYFLFYRLLSRLSSLEIPVDSGDFCVMTRRVADTINAMPEHHRFVRGLRSYSGFKQVGFYYKRDSRSAGTAKYNFAKLLRLAADGIFTFSEIPLKLSSFLGIMISTLSILYGIVLLIWRITSGQDLPGFATVAIGMFFLGGVQLLCIGVLGEYVGRIHNEVKARPSFIVESIVTKRSE